MIWVVILAAIREAYKYLLRSKYKCYKVFSDVLLSYRHLFAAPLLARCHTDILANASVAKYFLLIRHSCCYFS